MPLLYKTPTHLSLVLRHLSVPVGVKGLAGHHFLLGQHSITIVVKVSKGLPCLCLILLLLQG